MGRVFDQMRIFDIPSFDDSRGAFALLLGGMMPARI
ncbi:hypothetical protein X740_16705 [Mesorhizobium sp. LNHC221B00]|nr:hypothetical protein X740_16705 [Mesorhizobium sp. LNHC221B00]